MCHLNSHRANDHGFDGTSGLDALNTQRRSEVERRILPFNS